MWKLSMEALGRATVPALLDTENEKTWVLGL